MHERELPGAIFFPLLWWGDERQLGPAQQTTDELWKASEVQILRGFGSALGSLPDNYPNKGIMESFSDVRAQKTMKDNFSEMVGQGRN